MLLSIVIAVILVVAVFAVAAGGGAGAALAAAKAQIGKPYAYGTDGPGTFSCTGLVRNALRAAGVDAAAPWDHMAYLSVYPTRANPEPGDVVVYPDGVAMYAGDGMVVMANEVDGVVGMYPMNGVGTPLGFANPYGGAAIGPAAPGDAAIGGAGNPTIGQATNPAMTGAPEIPIDQPVLDPAAGDPGMVPDPTIPVDGAALPVEDPTLPVDTLADPALPLDPMADPMADPLMLAPPPPSDAPLPPPGDAPPPPSDALSPPSDVPVAP